MKGAFRTNCFTRTARLRPYRPRFPSRGSGAVALAIVLALWVARGSAAPAPGAPGTGPALRAPAPAAPNLPAREPLHPQPPDVLKAVEPNGLRLLAKPNPASDIVAIDCLVRVGLREE